MYIRPARPWLAVALSLVLPGLGHFYVGEGLGKVLRVGIIFAVTTFAAGQARLAPIN